MLKKKDKIIFLKTQIFIFAFIGLFIVFTIPVFSSQTSVTLDVIQLEADEDGYQTAVAQITVDPDKPTIIFEGTVGSTSALSGITIPSTVSDSDEIFLDFSRITIVSGSDVEILISNELTLIRNSLVAANQFVVVIPAVTTISNTGDSWNSSFLLPVLKTSASANPPSSNGQSAQVLKVLEIGSSVDLDLDKAARIKLPGQGNKRVGYVSGGSFTEITNTCENNTAPTVASGSDCKITVGSDIYIWTRHFSEFLAFRYPSVAAPVETPSSPGGGGFSRVVDDKFKAEVSISINNSEEKTDSRTVNLLLDGGGEAVKMVISDSTDFSNVSQDTFAENRPWLLSSGEGKKTVFIKFFNKYGRSSNVVNDSIVLEFPRLEPEAKVADIDIDGVIGLLDFNLLMVNWGEVEAGNPADLDQNGVIDIFDLNMIFVHWTT